MTRRGSRGAAVRRTLAVARATLRDLGSGCGGAFLLVAVLGALALTGSFPGVSPEDQARVTVLRRVDRLALLAVAVSLLLASWSVAEDRRSQRLQAWLVAPLRCREYLAGKVLGVLAGCTLLVVPWLLLVLLVPRAGLLGEHRWFVPRDRIAADSCSLGAARERSQTPWERGLLGPRDQVTYRFESLPAGREAQELLISVRGVGYGAGAARDAERGAAESERPAPPRVLVSDGTEAEVLVHLLDVLPETGEVVVLEPPVRPPLVVRIEGGGSTGWLAVERRSVQLLGRPGTIAFAIFRTALGLTLLVALSVGLGAALATVLPDVLALAGGALLLGVALARGLLLDVCTAVAAFPDELARAWVRALARGGEVLLAGLPDLAGVVGGSLLARGEAPFGSTDPGGFAVVLAWTAAAWVVGVLLLARLRRWAP